MVKIGKIKVAYIHCHTKYSERDSINEISDYIEKIKELNKNSTKYEITGLGISEHGNLYSMTKVCKACEETNLRHIVGFEAYHCLDYSQLSNKFKDIPRYHLVLMAKNEEGKKNLFKLATIAGNHKVDGTSKSFPMLDIDSLRKYGKGIIASSACIGGYVAQLILDGKINEAKKVAMDFKSFFDEFYLEVQPHIIPEQLLVNEKFVEFSRELKIPLVMGIDSHYRDRSDKQYHDLLMEINHYKPYNVEAYMYSFEELEQYCIDYNIPLDALTNTNIIAEQCNTPLKPKSDKGYMPDYPCPTGYNEESYLRTVTHNNLFEMVEKKEQKDVGTRIKRLDYELEVITSMGFSGYFLIIWDWFKWCRTNNIIMGKGRGSGCGSIVDYTLDITTVDPIKNKLMFERFMNPCRKEAPDVDSDIESADRTKGIQYLLGKYGFDKVSQIITFSKYGIRSIFRAAASAFGMPSDEMNEYSKKIPPSMAQEPVSYEILENVFKDPDKYADKYSEKEIREAKNAYDILQKVFIQYPKIYDAVRKLKGTIYGAGLHAGGVLISSESLQENFPMTTGSKTAVLPLIQIEMEDIPFYNLLKIDVLGLNSLDIIKGCMNAVGLDWDWYDNEDTSDDKVYEFLLNGNTSNVFQLMKSAPTRMLKDFKVKDIEGITSVNACNRPGPTAKTEIMGDKSMVDLYIEGANGNINKFHPDIDKILEETYGCIVYQEQCIEISKVMAGYDAGTADLRIRKPIAKKKIKMFAEIEVEFIYGKKPLYKTVKDENGKEKEVIVFKDKDGNEVSGYEENGRPVPSNEQSKNCEGAVNRGYDLELCYKIFDIMKEMGKYSFNKSHSSAYSFLSYKMAYLSLYHPTEFYYSCLAACKDSDKNKETISKAKRRGIKFLPPDINNSQETFSLEDDNGEKKIRYGLVDIMDVGASVTNLILTERNANGQFKDFADFIDRIINKNSQTVKDYLWNEETQKFKTNPLNKGGICALIKAGVFDYCEPNRFTLLNLYNTQINKDKTWVMLDESKYARADKLAFEKDRMKVYISEHPLEPFPYEDLSKITTENASVVFAGEIKSKESKSGKKSKYLELKVELKDDSVVRLRMFGKVKDTYSKICKVGSIMVFSGNYSPNFDSVTCYRVQEIVAATGQPASITELEDAFSPIPVMPGVDSTNIVDMLLGANKNE